MPELKSINPSKLKIDLRNPRVPDETFSNEDEAIEYLLTQADVGELIQSIGNSGWLDFEPPIVEKPTSIVVEGNRRIAALRILSDSALQSRFRVALPPNLHPNATPSSISVNFVESRKEARDFIGFKHVNGAFKWDSYAKARFALDWLQDGSDIDEVSKRLGDGHNTVSRLVNGVIVLDQAQNARLFDKEKRTKKSFYFSHLYTALSSPSVRIYVGLPENDNSVLQINPVPRPKYDQLTNLLSWLFGQENETSLITSQNPDLGRLVSILGNKRATKLLENNRDLDRAFDIVEDKAQAFENAFFKLSVAAVDVSGAIGRYDPRSDLVDEAEETLRVVNYILQSMKDVQRKKPSSDAS